jgi:hypothetical protein
LNSVEFLLPPELRTTTFTKPYVIVCEGYADARFICALLKQSNLTQFEVGCPHRETASDIPSYLKAIKTIEELRPSLKGILVVRDADTNADVAFAEAAASLAGARFPVPTTPFTVEGNGFRVAVFMVPGPRRIGTLEHLLYEAVLRKTPAVQNCVETFFTCVPGDKSHTENQRAKAHMSAVVAVSCKNNPWASCGIMWSEAGNPVPIDSECFQPLRDFLVEFTR